jgi:uncharacterized protein (DUF302 family)
MKHVILRTVLVATLSAAPIVSGADENGMKIYAFDGSFDDAAFSVENAIVGEGLVVDYVSHVGEMLERTKADVGSDVKVFDAANVYLFCSAQLSRKVMEADPMNLRFCPYSIFVMDQGGEVKVGYREMPEGPMKEVEALLDKIAKTATE